MIRAAGLILAALMAAPTYAAAQAVGFTRIEPVADPQAIALPAPEARGPSREIWDQLGPGNPAVRNVTRPTLTPILPDPAKATGTAVIVAPGGGFMMLSMQTEGFAVARALANRGVAAFVLKYRLMPTPESEADFGAAFGAQIAKGMAQPDRMLAMQHEPALEDGLAALAWVRAHASRYGLDTHRVGMIGFSAGAMTALNASLAAKPGQSPDFVGYIYGPQQSLTVPADAPPLFVAQAFDDQLFRTRGIPLVEAWQQAKRPVELHIYEKGGHGFGLGLPGTTSVGLIEQFTAWMDARGLLPSPVKRGSER